MAVWIVHWHLAQIVCLNPSSWAQVLVLLLCNMTRSAQNLAYATQGQGSTGSVKAADESSCHSTTANLVSRAKSQNCSQHKTTSTAHQKQNTKSLQTRCRVHCKYLAKKNPFLGSDLIYPLPVMLPLFRTWHATPTHMLGYSIGGCDMWQLPEVTVRF